VSRAADLRTRLLGPLYASPVGPTIREAVRATWSRARRLDAEDGDNLARIIRYVMRGDGCGLDVGAHYGSVLSQLVAVAPRGHHHAFEPLPHLAAGLRAEFPTVTVHECALAAAAGSSTFHRAVQNEGYSGLRRRTYERPDEPVEILKVQMQRLDDLLPPELPVQFCKIDVEGAELGVLEGARNTLTRWKPYVFFEHGLGAADHYGTTPEMIHAFMGEVGLAIFEPDGRGPLSANELRGIFDANTRWNFLARPY
jgi:FkbM family methyltransferase